MLTPWTGQPCGIEIPVLAVALLARSAALPSCRSLPAVAIRVFRMACARACRSCELCSRENPNAAAAHSRDRSRRSYGSVRNIAIAEFGFRSCSRMESGVIALEPVRPKRSHHEQ